MIPIDDPWPMALPKADRRKAAGGPRTTAPGGGAPALAFKKPWEIGGNTW